MGKHRAAAPVTRTGLTLALSAAGGTAAQLAGLPGGFLTGGAVIVAIAAAAGVPTLVPAWLRNIAFVLIGMLMGSSVARDSLGLMPQWPVTLAGLVVALVVIIWATGLLLQRRFGLDPATAYLSSFPGHLSLVMGIAETGHGNARQIAVIQSLRVLLLTVCVPVGALFLPPGSASAPAAELVSLQSFAVVGLACAIAGFALHWLKVPAGFVLGPMAVATAAKLGGQFEGALPAPLTIGLFVVMGALIGARFGGIGRSELMAVLKGGLVATVLAVGVVTIVSLACASLVDMPFGQIWIALAPGALEGMGALGVALGYDTAFIAAHHAARLLLLALAIPTVVVLIARRSRPTG